MSRSCWYTWGTSFQSAGNLSGQHGSSMIPTIDDIWQRRVGRTGPRWTPASIHDAWQAGPNPPLGASGVSLDHNMIPRTVHSIRCGDGIVAHNLTLHPPTHQPLLSKSTTNVHKYKKYGGDCKFGQGCKYCHAMPCMLDLHGTTP